jgi:hypothetical protein
MDWPKAEEFARALRAREQQSRTLLVPKLKGSSGYECVRLKILCELEYAVMNEEYAAMNEEEEKGGVTL